MRIPSTALSVDGDLLAAAACTYAETSLTVVVM